MIRMLAFSPLFFLFVNALAFAGGISDDFDQRKLRLINNTAINFSMQPNAFDGGYFSPPSFSMPGQSQQELTLLSYTPPRPANGVLLFMLQDRYVFSVIFKDQSASIHGCKSKTVFFHPDDYTCQLSYDDGTYTLTVQNAQT